MDILVCTYDYSSKDHRVRVRRKAKFPKTKTKHDAHFVSCGHAKNKKSNDDIGTTYLLCLALQVCVFFFSICKKVRKVRYILKTGGGAEGSEGVEEDSCR